MSVVNFTITFEDGRTRAVSFDRRRLKLKTLRKIQEAQRSMQDGEGWDAAIGFIGALLGITAEEADEIELGDWESIIAAMQQRPEAVPNASGPPSE